MEKRRQVQRGEADWDYDDFDSEDDETDPRKRRKRQRRKLKGKGKLSLIERQAESIKEHKTAREKRQQEEEAIMLDVPSNAGENVDESESEGADGAKQSAQ